MTPAQAAWLRKLRDRASHPIGTEWSVTRKCEAMGWIVLSPGVYRRSITPAGLAALSAYEEQGK